MTAKMKAAGYDVTPVEWGDIHVKCDDFEGRPVVKLKQSEDSIWLNPDDVDGLIEALNEARRS